MSSAWISYMLLTGTIVAVAVLAVDAACRLAGWQRRWAPFGGLLMVIALAIFAPESAPRTPRDFQLDLSSFPVTVIASPIATAPAQVASPFSDALRMIVSAAEKLPQMVASILPSRFEPIYNGAWVAASAILFLLFLLVHVRFLRARRGWPVFNLLGTDVRLSQAAGPAVVGAFRPDIVIPRWLLQREREQQQLVLEHEREHVRTRDPLMLVSAWTCALAMPWHPAVWWMLWKLRLAVELDCDARVLAQGTPRRSYGALLIELSQQSAGLPIGATALSDRTTHLERRLLAMNTHRPSFFRLRSTAFALLAIVMIVSACALKKPARNAEEPPASPAMPSTVAAPPVVTATAPPTPTAQPPVSPLPSTATAAPQPADSPTRFTQPLIIIDGVIQMQDDATLGRTPVPPQTTPQPPGIKNPLWANPGDSLKAPVIIIDGVIQNPNDPTIGRRAVQPATTPPVRVDTVGRTTPPPVPPVRPRVDTTLQLATSQDQQMGGVQIGEPLRLSQQQLGRLMIVVDGIIVMDTSQVLRNLTGGQIASVEVVTGTAATSLYGARARDGVLVIRTTTNANSTLSPLGGRGGGGRGAGTPPPGSPAAGLQIRGGSTPGSDVVVQIRNPLSMTGQPMIILNGVIQRDSTGALVSGDALSKVLEPSKIASIEVVRGAAAVALYGQDAANGVINIVTKR